MSVAAPIDADVVRRALGDRWARFAIVAQANSTNADLLADLAAPDRSVLVAEHQAAGRGRLDRQWTSPAGSGLTFSALLRPTVPLLRWGWLPLLAGVALCEAVGCAVELPLALKWPNDLLASSAQSARKLAGILVQTSGDAVVIGIGINVFMTEEELPVPTATSLALCGVSELDRSALLVAILTRLDARYAQWSDFGGDAEACGLAAAYCESCATIGADVTVTTAESVILGRAVGIDPAGRLVLDVNGAEQAIAAGDVEHVRAGGTSRLG